MTIDQELRQLMHTLSDEELELLFSQPAEPTDAEAEARIRQRVQERIEAAKPPMLPPPSKPAFRQPAFRQPAFRLPLRILYAAAACLVIGISAAVFPHLRSEPPEVIPPDVLTTETTAVPPVSTEPEVSGTASQAVSSVQPGSSRTEEAAETAVPETTVSAGKTLPAEATDKPTGDTVQTEAPTETSPSSPDTGAPQPTASAETGTTTRANAQTTRTTAEPPPSTTRRTTTQQPPAAATTATTPEPSFDPDPIFPDPDPQATTSDAGDTAATTTHAPTTTHSQTAGGSATLPEEATTTTTTTAVTAPPDP